MSVDALVESIEAEADAEASRLLAEADAEATARVAGAEAAARARVAAMLAAAQPGILGAEARALNAARLAPHRRTARLGARSEAAFVLAEDRVARTWTAAVRPGAGVSRSGGWRRRRRALSVPARSGSGPPMPGTCETCRRGSGWRGSPSSWMPTCRRASAAAPPTGT